MQMQTATQELILIVEDNENIAEFIVDHLQAAGFEAAVAESGERALAMLGSMQPALIVLDVVLGDIDGFEVCRRIRQGTWGRLAPVANVPVVMLTARGEEADRIDGFSAGVDDYVVKPFNPDELTARIHAILRRVKGTQPATLQIGGLMIDPFQRVAQAAGATLDLTPKEFDLLHVLASRFGQVVPRTLLLEQVWGYTYDGNTRTVDVHVQRLREKLDAKTECACAIKTEWGVGYKMMVQ